MIALSAAGAIDLMALRLLVLEFFCFLAIRHSLNRVVYSVPLKIYTIYLIWIIIGCFYSPAIGYGLRVILKYIYILLIALAGSTIVRDNRVLLSSCLWARKVGIISLILFIPGIGMLLSGVFWYGTARAISYQFLTVFSLALACFSYQKKKNLIFTIIFCIPCLLWVFRTSIMGTTIALMIFALFKYKLKAIPAIFGVFILFIIIVFSFEPVRNKMFIDSNGKSVEQLQNGQITADDINSNGRFAMWEWSLKKFYDGKELTGSGTGNLQETFYALRHPFSTIKICHNDYVQILCDNGLIGLVLFGGSMLLIIFHCFFVFQHKDYGPVIKIAAISVGSSLGGMLLSMYTDNAINYTMATFSFPLGCYGMMLGLIQKYKEGI